MSIPAPLLEIQGLELAYPSQRGFSGAIKSWKTAVSGLSLNVAPAGTYALIGESGCGKSSTGRALCGLLAAKGGNAWYRPSEKLLDLNPSIASRLTDGRIDLLSLKGKQWAPFRTCLSMVFQDSATALNPMMSVANSVAEPLVVNRWGSAEAIKQRVKELFELVDVDPSRGSQRPHLFSGGQRQRICIARALALKPDFIICDEIVSALDVVVQKRILSLLRDIQHQFGTSYLFISHDLTVVSNFADEVGVMQDGELVESGKVAEVFYNPQHDCTKRLLASIPTLKA